MSKRNNFSFVLETLVTGITRYSPTQGGDQLDRLNINQGVDWEDVKIERGEGEGK